MEVGGIRHVRPPCVLWPKAGKDKLVHKPVHGGLLVTNPPDGTRLRAHGLDDVCVALGKAMRGELPGWRAAVLVADERQATLLGTSVAAGAPRLRNGPTDCRLLLFDVGRDTPSIRRPSNGMRVDVEADPSARPGSAERPATRAARLAAQRFGGSLTVDRAADQFRNRLRRNARALGRPLRRQGTDCFRVYDADLQDFNLAVDLYRDWAHIQEYRPPVPIDATKAAARLHAAVEVIAETLELPPDHVVVKVRRRQRCHSQHERERIDRREQYTSVHEGDATYLVNLTDRIATGLFLVQRLVRALIGSLAPRASLPNLFDSTVHHLDRRRHRTLHTNGMASLKIAAEDHRRYDLMLFTPPTFSSSSRMAGATLDLPRDHVELVRRAARLLTAGGTLLIVSEAHRVTFAVDRLTVYTPIDLSNQTLPADFSRRTPLHYVWQLTTPGSQRKPRRTARATGRPGGRSGR